MKQVTLLLLVAVCSASQISFKPFEAGKVYKYGYQTKMKVINPAARDVETEMLLNTTVKLHFDSFDQQTSMFTVQLELVDPVLKVIQKEPRSPVGKTVKQLDIETMKKELLTTVQFAYTNGMVKKIQHSPEEKLWSLNIKKGVLNMVHLDVNRPFVKQSTVFESNEVTIHGTCKSIYTMDTPLSPLSKESKRIRMRKTVNVAECRNSNMRVFTNIFSEDETTKKPSELPSPLSAVSTFTYDIIKTSTSFRINHVEALGEFVFLPFGDVKDGITSLVNQTLQLLKEEESSGKPELKGSLVDDTLVMKVEDHLIATDKPRLDTIEESLKVIIKKLITDVGNSDLSIPEELVLGLTRQVKLLRELDINQIERLWDEYVKNDHADRDESKWFVRVLSLVNSNNAMKVFLNKITKHPESLSTKLIEEFVSMIPNSPFIQKDTVKHIQNLCEVQVIAKDKRLLRSCMVMTANVIKLYCQRSRHCDIQTPQRLLQVLERISNIVQLPLPQDLTEEDILEHLIVTETMETKDALPLLMKIVKNKILPVHILQRAVLTIRPFVLRQKSNVTLPLMEIFKDLDYHDEVRLAALKAIMRYPSPSVLTALVHSMKVEPSLSLRKHFFDRLITIIELNSFPVEIMDAVKIAKDMMYQLRLFPVQNRFMREHAVSVYPLFEDVPGFEIVMTRCLSYTNKSILPAEIESQLDLRILGRRVSLLSIELGEEGLQEVLRRFVETLPRLSKLDLSKLPAEIEKITEKITSNQSIEERAKIFTNVKLFGRQFATILKTFELNENPLKQLLTKETTTLVELAKKINKGMEYKCTAMVMPIDMSLRIPTCAGFTLVHDLSTVIVSKFTAKISAESKPDIFSLRSWFFSSPVKSITAHLDVNLRASALIQGSVFFVTPLLRCGSKINAISILNQKPKVAIDVNLETLEYTKRIELPKTIKEILRYNKTLENFVSIDENAKVTVLRQPILPTHVFDKLKIITECNRTENFTLQDTVELKINGQYIDARSGNLELSNVPAVWKLVHFGKHGRVVALYKKDIGYITIDPITKELKITPYQPTYWLLTAVDQNDIVLQTLSSPKSPHMKNASMSKMDELHRFVKVFQSHEVEISEMENVHRMFSEDLFAYEVDIVTIGLGSHNKVVATSLEKVDQSSICKIKMVYTAVKNLEKFLKKYPLCYGEESEYRLCVNGLQYQALPKSFRTLLMPTSLNISLPEQKLKSLVFEVKAMEEQKNLKVYTGKLILEGTKTSFVTTLKRNLGSGKISLILRRVEEKSSESQLMCLNMETFNDTLSMVISLEPTCQAKHFELSINSSRIIPRHRMHIDYVFSMEQIPDYWLDIVLPMIEMLPQIVSFKQLFGENIRSKRISKPFSEQVDFDVIQGQIRIMLLSEEVAKITVETPTDKYSHKLALPFKLYSLPIGDVKYPLISKLPNVLRPSCFVGRNYISTFDGVGAKYHVHDTCEHIIMKSCSRLVPQFKVTMKRSVQNGTRIVHIILEKNEIKILPKRYDQIPEIVVNNKMIHLKNYNIRLNLENKFHVAIIYDPNLHEITILNEELGLELQITGGRTISSRVSSLLLGKVCGMCGKYDSETFNDLMTPDRIRVKNGQLFGTTWVIPGKDCKSTCPFIMKKKAVQLTPFGVCTTLVKLPSCMKSCEVEEKIFLKDVPVSCPKSPLTKRQTVSVPSRCKCHCGVKNESVKARM